MTELLEQAKAFFDQYGSVFDSGDMAEFSAFFSEPCLSVRPDGRVQSMPTHNDAESFFASVLASWRREGYKRFGKRDIEIVPIGKRSMLVTLTWELLGQQGNLIRDWRQSYNLVMHGDAWKIIASTYHADHVGPSS